MDTRLLYTIALVIATVVGSFYYFSGKSKKLETAGNQNLNSTAENIQVIQTSENGQLYAKATAKHLTQWMQDNRAEIEQIQGILYENGRQNATFHADQLIARNDYQDIELTGNVEVSQFDPNQQQALQFKTQSLKGDLKTHKIRSTDTVYITHPQGQFTSQGLEADLNTGQYDFFKIRGIYAPAK